MWLDRICPEMFYSLFILYVNPSESKGPLLINFPKTTFDIEKLEPVMRTSK